MAFSTVREVTAEERVQKCYVDILNNPHFIAECGVLIMGERTVRDDIPTAATNGRDVYFGRKMVEKLSDAELRYLILHENRHKIFRHLHVWKHLYDIDHACANIACDHVINLGLNDTMPVDSNGKPFAVMPVDKETGEPMGFADTRFRNMDAQQVFEIIYKERQNPDPEDGDGDGDGSDGYGDHAPKPGGNQPQGFVEHDWDGADDMTKEEVDQLTEDIDRAVRQGMMAAGKLGGGVDRDLQKLLQPEVDWREVLREFISATCKGSDYTTYARPNRRYMSAGKYMPSGESEQLDELVIAIDTSCSVEQPELTKFLSEVDGIVKHVKPKAVRLLYWDTQVRGDELYGDSALPPDMLVNSTKPAGGGGTSITCVNEYMTRNQIKGEAVVVFTDGYLGGDWGTWDVPVMWCILDNKIAKPTNGTAVHVKL